MKILIDDADFEKIREIYCVYSVDGVTTNPTILAKTGKPPFEILKGIREYIGQEAELHVQVVAGHAEGMLEDARRILKELGENTYIKVPVTREGLKAIKALKMEDVNVTATAVYTRMQAFLAGKAGADYTAPYVNRIDNLGADGLKTAKDIHDIFKRNGMRTEVLAASFKNSQQILELCEYGVGASTIAPDIMEGMIKNECVTAAVERFVSDFEQLCGTGKTMSDC